MNAWICLIHWGLLVHSDGKVLHPTNRLPTLLFALALGLQSSEKSICMPIPRIQWVNKTMRYLLTHMCKECVTERWNDGGQHFHISARNAATLAIVWGWIIRNRKSTMIGIYLFMYEVQTNGCWIEKEWLGIGFLWALRNDVHLGITILHMRSLSLFIESTNTIVANE